MIQTIKTYAEVLEKTKEMNFKHFYSWVAKSHETDLTTDIAEYDSDELAIVFEYKGVVFDVVCDFTPNNVGQPLICGFWKDSKCAEDDYYFDKNDVHIVSGYEVDWYDFFHGCYYALNNHSKEFENCSGIKKFIYLSTEAREKMNIFESKCDDLADYIIYNKNHEKVGYVIVIEDQE